MQDKEAILSLTSSRWWELIITEIDNRIKDIEEVLLTPISDLDRLSSEKMTAEEKIKFIEIKQKERDNLLFIKSIPQSIIDSEVMTIE